MVQLLQFAITEGKKSQDRGFWDNNRGEPSHLERTWKSTILPLLIPSIYLRNTKKEKKSNCKRKKPTNGK